MKPIVTDSQPFESMRQQDCLYVDKTDFVWRLASGATRYYFLARPRRFGKSLLLSTLNAYFSGRKELFSGLKIEQLALEKWEKWPVVRLDMSISIARHGVQEMHECLTYLLQREAKRLAVSLEADLPSVMFAQLLDKVSEQTGKQVVVLIDEYDKPILDSLHTPYADEVLQAVHDFYLVLKKSNDLLRFVFITGVSKFAHTSLFSGMNNLTDITLDEDYASILGYTQEELLGYFPDNIKAGAAKYNLSEEQFVAHVKEWYDGFVFAPGAEPLFNPVSVGRFFNGYQFANYWYETGTPTFLVELLRRNPLQLETYTQRWYPFNDFAKSDIHNLSPFDLAIQTGYLTIKETRMDGLVRQCRYDLPNQEIRQSWSRSMLPLMARDWNDLYDSQDQLRTAIYEGDIPSLMEGLQWLIEGLSYENIGRMREGDYRNLLKIAFTSMGYHAHAEDHTLRGRIDLTVLTPRRAFVFELKLMREGQNPEELLDEACNQLREKHYADKYRLTHETVHSLALVFDAQTHALVAWKEC